MADRPLVLVTGASGFVGSHVVDALLRRGERVRVLVRGTSNLRWLQGKPVELARAGLDDPAALRGALRDVQTVLHFGGRISAPSERAFRLANAVGTENLGRAFAGSLDSGAGGTFLYCSSLAAGGPAGSRHPEPYPHVREEDPPQPVSAYGRSKLEGERRLPGALAGRARLVILRPSAVYGPRDEGVLFFLRTVERGWIPIPARRGATLSLIDVWGLVDATLRALDLQAAQGIYYVSDGLAHTWDDVGVIAARVLGVRARPLRMPYPITWLATLGLEGIGRLRGRAPILSFDKMREVRQSSWVSIPDRARMDLGFTPMTDLEKGFEETVRWYRKAGWLRSA